MGMLFNISGLITIILAIISAILCDLGGRGVRNIKLEDFVTYVGGDAVFSRFPRGTYTISQHPSTTAMYIDNYLIHDMDCYDTHKRYTTNESFATCRGIWQAAEASLDKNIDAQGFTKPNLKKTKRCDTEALSTYAYNAKDISLFDPDSSESFWPRTFGKYFYRSDEKSQQDIFRRCLQNKRIPNFSIYVVIGTCVTIALAIVGLIVAGSASGQKQKDCAARGPAMLFALAVLSFSAMYFFTHNHLLHLQRSNTVRKCVDDPKEFYYDKLPAKECVLNRVQSQCSIVPLSTADRLEDANKDIVMCSSGTIDFVHDTTKKKDCKSATAICSDASKVTSPPRATTTDADGVEKVEWCAECTSGPDWSLQDSYQTFNVGIRDTTTGAYEWTGRSSSTNGNVDQNNPCVWVDEPLPIIVQKGHGTTTAAAPAKSCINRFNFLDNHKCQAASYPEFLFEYGHPEKCSTPAGRGNTLGSHMYPDCVTPNYEKCYVKRGGAPQIRVTDEPTTRGGDSTGDNNCVLEREDETECKCECSATDYYLEKCEYSAKDGTHDGIGKMTEDHPMYKICQSKVCSNFQEKKQCDFLGDDSNTDDSKKRYFAEKGLCTDRQTTKPSEKNYCGTLATHCGVNAAGQCVSKYVACNDEQQQKFDEKKEVYLRSLVPKQCLTDQAGKYGDEKATKQFLDHAQLIMAGIVTLSITTLFIFLLALSMQMNGDDGSKKNSVAVAPIELRSWDAGK
jgi:hypothetical protein